MSDQSNFGVILIAWLAAASIMGILGAWVAEQKGRKSGEGAFLGFLFGPLGVVVEGLLPDMEDEEEE